MTLSIQQSIFVVVCMGVMNANLYGMEVKEAKVEASIATASSPGPRTVALTLDAIRTKLKNFSLDSDGFDDAFGKYHAKFTELINEWGDELVCFLDFNLGYLGTCTRVIKYRDPSYRYNPSVDAIYTYYFYIDKTTGARINP